MTYTAQEKRYDKKSDAKSLRTIAVYCLIVVSLIVISLLFKSVTIFLNSTFTSKTQFTVVIRASDTESTIITFNPEKKSLVDVSVMHAKGMNPEYAMGILTDGVVTALKPVERSSGKAYLSYFLFHPGSYKTKLTILDMFRIWLYSTFTAQDVVVKEITLPLSEPEIETTLTNVFHDDLFVADNVTIEIVNGTGVPGLAGKLERAIARIGGNVIAISNARPDDSTSQIMYYDDNEGEYVRERIAKLLNFPLTQVNRKALSDIIIVIGKDDIPPILK